MQRSKRLSDACSVKKLVLRSGSAGAFTRAANVAVAVALLCQLGTARAQSNAQQLADANRSAMEAYNNLDVEAAKGTLEKAARNAEKHGVRGPALARTYANLAVVLVGGLGDQAGATAAFARALKEDPKVEPDPLVATPEVIAAFNTAKANAKPAEAAPEPQPEAAPPPRRGGSRRPTPSTFEGNLDHTPAAEQLTQTPIPVFVRAGPDSNIEKVTIFYRSIGMERPKSTELQRADGGFAYLIPCSDVFEPAVEYFLVATGDDDKEVGYAGTAEAPISVPIVTVRSGPAPSLPGQPPPRRCSAAMDNECPPGMPGCHGSAGLGDSCRADSDCQSGMICSDDFCTLGERADEEESGKKSRAKRFFADVNFGVSGVAVGSGRAADRAVSPALVNSIASNPQAQTNGSINDRKAQVLLRNQGYQCDTSLTTMGALAVKNCTVAVDPGGMVPVPILSIAAGYYVTQRTALAATARIQTDHGQGPLAGMLLGAQAEYLLMKPASKGLRVGLLGGASAGQIQARPHSSSAVKGPYATNANVGGVGFNVTVGARVGYRFMKYLGVNIWPALNFALPNFLFALDVTGGLEVAF